jgi:hypothetical protein
VQPGWYGDPQSQSQVRWYDGTNWTEHVRAAHAEDGAAPRGAWGSLPQTSPDWSPPDQPEAGSTPGMRKPRAAKKIVLGAAVVLGGLIVIGALASGGSDVPTAESASRTQPAPGPALEEGGVDLATVSCDDAVAEAVAISAASGDLTMKLLKVREPAIIEDRRTDFQLPAGTDDALVLACGGAGVWEDGSNSPVRVEVRVDADEDVFISYEPT